MERRKLSDLIISPTWSIQEAIEVINRNGVRGVFVCDENNELLGIVMDPDIRRAILKKDGIKSSVKTIMKTSPFTLSASLSDEERIKETIDSGKVLVPVLDDFRKVVDYIFLHEILELESFKRAACVAESDRGVFPPSKILVLGGAGFAGSVLVDKLLRIGHQVRCLDLLLYDNKAVELFRKNDDFEFIRADCRDEDVLLRAVEGVDAVIHLGEIVGDPACNVNEDFTIDTNYLATSKIVNACIRANVPRFIFASSCSVYGQNSSTVNEASELHPVSLYARCKIECERAILSSGYKYFCPTVLRLATLHGRSYRQRFDLVVNLLCIKALTEKKIQVFGGNQWRPFIAVRDVCKGIVMILHSEREKIQNQIFNLGDDRENYTISQVSEIIKDILPEVDVEYIDKGDDPRNYRVSFEKIRNTFGFTSEYTISDTLRQFMSLNEDDNLFVNYMDPKYHNLLSLR